MQVGFDLISDLHLSPDDSFNWEGKATSLYCLVAGNISSDLRTIFQTLAHLSLHYQGVFYVLGPLEYKNSKNLNHRTQEILNLTSKIKNVAVLYHHVVIIDGIAILGANGWYANEVLEEPDLEMQIEAARYEDVAYLKQSIQKLQKHLDVRKILLVTNAVPKDQLYFGEIPPRSENYIPLDLTLIADTEHKVTHWAFGTYEKIVDTAIDNINYFNNPYYKKRPYWAKRVDLTV